ncbi:helicase-like transcription factor CHR28 isoform X3 [Ananas comosus]|uniref:Helicase-like transcription factor CHR28 isoform X3 n=1 Tax=Ananas comosus TaxID=4615 RepID=A0A6P5FR04_ANACO|nr:helicase-like transcription factor CHR28 isoform X3 [Ananas comosus]
MPMAESVEDPGGGFFRSDLGDGRSDHNDDNLSISLGDLFAILDEEPRQSQPYPAVAAQKSICQGKVADPIVNEKVFQPQDADWKDLGEELGCNLRDIDASNCQNLTKFQLLSESEENFEPFMINEKSHRVSEHDSSKNSFSFMSNHTPDWLSYPTLEYNMLNSNVAHDTDGAYLLTLEHANLGNGLYLDGNEERDYKEMTGVKEIESGALPERDLSGSMTRYAFVDHEATLPYAFPGEMNTSEATELQCNTSGSCLTLHRESISDENKNGSKQFISAVYQQPLLPHVKESLIRINDKRKDQLLHSHNSGRSSEVQLGTQELLDISLSGFPMSFMDASSPSTLSFEHCEDIHFRSESSTDSSPHLSSRNSTSENFHTSSLDTTKQFMFDSNVYSNMKKETFSKNETEDKMLPSSVKQPGIPEDTGNVHMDEYDEEEEDDDTDLYIVDNISDPAHPPLPPVHQKPNLIYQRSAHGEAYYSGFGGMRLKANDERLTFRLILQDLSQPKSEATPPDGLLAVPLLRHQRIALSWMVQKECASLHCSGGILADDQGLGKTVSTIALILTERSPSSRSSTKENLDNYETLDLDDDDDDDGDVAEVYKTNITKQPRISTPAKKENLMMVMSRPAAGTLVVCPTSVLRQWAEELQNKVTSKANLSFLVYHGSNRTKDPNDLAKYDVVLTTYAIVSMEVPKQPLVDKDEEEKVKPDTSTSSVGHIGGKKRKIPGSSVKNPKLEKTMENALFESAARPLARVGWFRVILDEAQSIKNHRTQVARACWGLRAKRRWCLSGTPIQNAVDDLYSYFRFLRYDPYAAYKSFCSMIKVPINRNPTNGYKKLQAVLKTIMLRRTKGTLIDGQPIITLPPKTVTLKKVDFSMEERTFYSTLEAESREQFKVYADAGTVKQNYVNILLMLLRLRQACDHPLLVKGYDSSSVWRSSLEMAKKLPMEKQQNLLSCLEHCSAICTICNDAPEDAVITICGHVFCHQCICEHLTGDDSICPSAGCKVRLNVASVFSRGTLQSALSGVTGGECCPNDSGSEMTQAGLFYDSSKVRTALQILQSLPRAARQDSSMTTKSAKLNDETAEISDGKNFGPIISSDSCVTEKAIVFSQWTGMLDLLEVPLKDSSIQYRRLDGTMSVAAREKAVKDFNTRPEVSVMIMSLKAASLGLNMVAACHVLLLDLWWNPTTEDQAIDRAHRIGQTRPVTVSRLTVKDTVEDRILALQQRKREMVASAFGEDESGSRQTRLTVEDLKYLFMV